MEDVGKGAISEKAENGSDGYLWNCVILSLNGWARLVTKNLKSPVKSEILRSVVLSTI